MFGTSWGIDIGFGNIELEEDCEMNLGSEIVVDGGDDRSNMLGCCKNKLKFANFDDDDDVDGEEAGDIASQLPPWGNIFKKFTGTLLKLSFVETKGHESFRSSEMLLLIREASSAEELDSSWSSQPPENNLSGEDDDSGDLLTYQLVLFGSPRK